MDFSDYLIVTPVISLLSFVIFVALLIAGFVTKKKFKVKHIFIFILLLIGMYLLIPLKYTFLGFGTKNPELLKKLLNF